VCNGRYPPRPIERRGAGTRRKRRTGAWAGLRREGTAIAWLAGVTSVTQAALRCAALRAAVLVAVPACFALEGGRAGCPATASLAGWAERLLGGCDAVSMKQQAVSETRSVQGGPASGANHRAGAAHEPRTLQARPVGECGEVTRWALSGPLPRRPCSHRELPQIPQAASIGQGPTPPQDDDDETRPRYGRRVSWLGQGRWACRGGACRLARAHRLLRVPESEAGRGSSDKDEPLILSVLLHGRRRGHSDEGPRPPPI
jgi:hypothetical protein